MKVILKRDMEDLGFEGEILDVAKGYARNFLIPKGLALPATEQNVKSMEQQRKKIEVKKLKAKEDAEKVKEKIEGVVVTISQKVGEEEKLYGSVTTMDIASQLAKQGIEIDRRKISLDRPIKTLGEFEVPVKLHPEVTGSVKVVVIPEE
ncbi:MAG: 50S ribosomal protein L9 [Deltaproteobacteria bacterium]|nr:50S ribosomal protein L9 [Deltaproteobacteria bacterium]MBW1918890.1 50S ribosomal protein L9 [Deltaproteobacteria bacterium]MBW1934676.1 50S ribosomal protein L9 [Deltaproteobacteria bacterium]MBW1976950.1 50S ribosomal protein L9 [Deltaproteobacteria bacterium]MBW2043534.1 50S ribosomal protein L9 [Deltaproteobacteria bacterium]